MARVKKEEVKEEVKETKKKTTKKVEDNLNKGYETFNNSSLISLDYSPVTMALVKDIKNDESKRENLVYDALNFGKVTEEKCRGFYMNGNQFSINAINLHIDRMNKTLQFYEFLYTQSKSKVTHEKILNNILYIINDILYPRQYEVFNSFGTTYEQFVLNPYISSELVNKYNYYNNELAKARMS